MVLTTYVSSYQHVYSQSSPVALLLAALPNPIVTDILDEQAYEFDVKQVLPADLSGYRVIIATGDVDITTSLPGLRTYVENGGGFVYLSLAAESADLATSYEWLGAQSVGHAGLGENATISVENPLGTGMHIGDLLMQQAPQDFGNIWVNDLQVEAEGLAEYTSGNVFAYIYESGEGRVYFQGDTHPGVAPEGNLENLLKAGILWATSETSAESPIDLLPEGTEVSTGNDPPRGSVEAVFSDQGPQSYDFFDPVGMTRSIFVTATSEVVGATLFFDSEGQQYSYNVQPDSNTLLTFPVELNVTDVSVTIVGSVDSDGEIEPAATVGYVTVREPPACVLPAGSSVKGSSSIPGNSMQAGSLGTAEGSSLEIAGPVVPINSLFVGYHESEANGFAIAFRSNGVGYSCPVSPSMVQISFSQPVAITDVEIRNVGPWGVVGYSEPFDGQAYVHYNISKATRLPFGSLLQTNITSQGETSRVLFSPGELALESLAIPTGGEVAAIWISAGQNLVDPFLYFRSGDEWYSMPLDRESAGILISFSDDLGMDELYVSVESAGSDDQIVIGYMYPVEVNADAGSDQSVEEQQLVYLDGTASAGREGGISFVWKQIDGPKVALQGARTATASFAAPQVGDSGARLSFMLTVTDSKGKLSQDTVAIRVRSDETGPNQRPVIGTLEDITVTEGSQVVLAASASDPDGDELTYAWIQKRGAAVLLNGANTATLSFVAPQVSMHTELTFQIKVTDENGMDAIAEVSVFVNETAVPLIPSVFAGEDQQVTEGSPVVLQGSGTLGPYDFRWGQVGGISVILSNPSELRTSFAAPQVADGTSEILTFQLSLLDENEKVLTSDQVAIVVKSVASSPSVTTDKTTQPEITLFDVGQPAFSIVGRGDVVPPQEIFALSFLGSGPSVVTANAPSAKIVGIWLNVSGGLSDVTLDFTHAGLQYRVDQVPINRAVAYLFNSSLAISDIRVGAASSGDQDMQIGYYYDQVPLIPVLQSEQFPVNLSQVSPSSDSDTKGIVTRNLLLVGATAIGVPAGIAVALRVAHARKGKWRMDSRQAARTLFPKIDPVAGEAEKVRPVIEELERMLGKKMDTAVNASELLERFASGVKDEGSEG